MNATKVNPENMVTAINFQKFASINYRCTNQSTSNARQSLDKG